jgi:phosphatidylserine/phosphatidylglycerophosphate/cardiolipin synthase-like enzyme
MFSPNTQHKLVSPPKETPNDMNRVFDLINGARQAVLFLAFDPGNNSILDAAGRALAKNPDLFVRGALTSPQRALNFSEALHQGGATEQSDGAGPAAGSDAKVTVVGEPGQPKKKGAKLPSATPDSRAVPAGAVTKDDAFGLWEAELAKYGFAIIHTKIVMIDPFSDNCTVVTGSHNLGFRASHNNDENMVIIRGHRGLAEAYACHVLDLYDHYAWRFLLKEHPDIFGKPLAADDKWQERYITGADEKAPELRFWLAAAGGGAAASGVAPPSKKPAAPAQPAAGPGDEPVTTKPAKTTKKKAAAKKKSATKRSSRAKAAKKAVRKTAKKKKAAKRPARKAAKKKTAGKSAEKSTKKRAVKKR